MSDGSECLGWREARRTDGGEKAGDGADGDRGGEATCPRERGDDDRPLLDRGVDRGGEDTGSDARGAAEQGEQDRLGEELAADVALGCTERSAQADLGAAFEDTDEHDV